MTTFEITIVLLVAIVLLLMWLIVLTRNNYRLNQTKELKRAATSKAEKGCLLCANYPCFDGIENLESDFAKEGCHAFRKREEKQ